MTRDWVMVASHRQDRPQMPEDFCPFCPDKSDKVPKGYAVHKYDNDFPALSTSPPVPDGVGGGLFKVGPSYGKCEIILYSPDHHATLPQLSVPHVASLVDLWAERHAELARDPLIKYVFIFENRGEVVGVTMPHPHGQIYGYPFVPKKIELELASCAAHHDETGRCLICDLAAAEVADGRRLIFGNASFVTYLPFFSEYPYGVYIASKGHVGSIDRFGPGERLDLAEAIRSTVGMYDALFGKPFPYMMCMHQSPVNVSGAPELHFHVEFFPPMRSEAKQKFNASSETGVWAHCNPTAPEEKAVELREAYGRFLAGGG